MTRGSAPSDAAQASGDARSTRLRDRLSAALAPCDIDIVDDSHLHAGHAGARHGGHYSVTIVAAVFAGKNLLERHRIVYAAVGDLMNTDIHALSIKALTPHEASAVSQLL